ncbi:hypothetical protein FOZ63_006568 [Perkinsus olseni]|uniref:Uncharacterized protein n=1 Tax=Perkinsus olseni TaxID=32597 RepID=A0A7J6U2G9_PEROL|nr:hypothetical protein FOZ63_006568 [Perkinsus olseni]
MVLDDEPLGRRRHCRSAEARKRRNRSRRERYMRQLDARDAVAADRHDTVMDPFKLLRFYASAAAAFRTRQKDKCLDDLSDGTVVLCLSSPLYALTCMLLCRRFLGSLACVLP